MGKTRPVLHFRPLAERYSNLEPSQPFVSAIAIRPLGNKSDGTAG